MILDIPVQLTVELGRTRVPIRNILQLGEGSVVELGSRDRGSVVRQRTTGPGQLQHLTEAVSPQTAVDHVRPGPRPEPEPVEDTLNIERAKRSEP